MAGIKYNDLIQLLKDFPEYLSEEDAIENLDLEIIFQSELEYGKIDKFDILFGVVQLDAEVRNIEIGTYRKKEILYIVI